jgi:hypothetical protein
MQRQRRQRKTEGGAQALLDAVRLLAQGHGPVGRGCGALQVDQGEDGNKSLAPAGNPTMMDGYERRQQGTLERALVDQAEKWSGLREARVEVDEVEGGDGHVPAAH